VTVVPTPAIPRGAITEECRRLTFPTRSTTMNSAGNRRVLNGHLLWNGAAYLMNWKQLQTIIYDVDVCAPSSYYVNVGDARIYGMESNVDYRVNSNWSLQAAGSYNDPHITASPYPNFQANIGERLPYVPFFAWSGNLRYEHPLIEGLRGYAQFDIAHKGAMWDDFHVQAPTAFRASCSRATAS